MEDFAALPLSLLKLVVELASDERHEDVYPHAPHVPHDLLASLRQSDPLWERVIEQLRASLDVAVTVSLPSTFDPSVISSLFTGARAAPVKSVAFTIETSVWEADEEMEAAWCEAFERIPLLERLDLSEVSLDNAQLPLIIKAASLACSGVQALVLCARVEDTATLTKSKMETLRAAVYSAAQRWRQRTTKRGLKQLEFPVRYAPEELQDIVYLEALEYEFYWCLVEACTDIEYLNMVELQGQAKAHVIAGKVASCPIDTWSIFCLSCQSLRQLAWIHFPYTDTHFRVFGMETWPFLKRLVFDGAEGAHTANADGASLYSTKGIITALDACPRLEELEIRFAHSLSIPNGFHRQRLWNDDILSNFFMTRPPLRVFKLLEYSDTGDAIIPTPLDAITHFGFAMLATLHQLRFIEMKATGVSGAGVFELVNNAPRCGDPLVVKLDVGCLLLEGSVDDDDANVIEFYDVVVSALDSITLFFDNIRTARFHVTLHNRSRRDPDTDEWRARLDTLIKAAPIDVHVEDESGRIERIILQSRSSE